MYERVDVDRIRPNAVDDWMIDAIIKHRNNDTDMVVVSALRWLLCTKKGFEWGGVGKRGHTVSNVPKITGIDALY
jgi:hypothetical protein